MNYVRHIQMIITLLVAMAVYLMLSLGTAKEVTVLSNSPVNGTMIKGTDLQPAAKQEVIPVTGEIK